MMDYTPGILSATFPKFVQDIYPVYSSNRISEIVLYEKGSNFFDLKTAVFIAGLSEHAIIREIIAVSLLLTCLVDVLDPWSSGWS